MKEIRDIIKAFDEAHKLGKQTALATVVHVEGSSYRRPGARMLIEDDGQLTGAILFIPLSVWVIYASVFRGPCSGKVVGVSFAIGAVTHALLFLGYGFFKAGVFGGAGLLAYAVVIGFTPIILAAVVSRFFKPELLRPVPSLQGAA